MTLPPYSSTKNSVKSSFLFPTQDAKSLNFYKVISAYKIRRSCLRTPLQKNQVKSRLVSHSGGKVIGIPVLPLPTKFNGLASIPTHENFSQAKFLFLTSGCKVIEFSQKVISIYKI